MGKPYLASFETWSLDPRREAAQLAHAANELAFFLHAAALQVQAEPLMRRALAIDEQSFGKEHPSVAIGLNNLAQLLQDTNRLAEARPLMRRALEIFLQFSHATGHRHLHLQTAMNNYAGLLRAMGRSAEQVAAELNAMSEPYGIRIGGDS